MAGGASISERVDGKTVFRILSRSLRVDWRDYVVLVADRLDGNPFAVLAAIILSQNTSSRSSIRAYHSLRMLLGRVTPEAVLSVPEEKLGEAIRAAGLWRQKARALREAARRILEAGGERVLMEMPPEKLREFLLSIPGVGKKTADVFLSFKRRAPVFAVDTHALRIAKRWGLVGEKAGYDEASRALLEFFGPERSEEAHRLLIALGRQYCRARGPRCSECPLRGYCPYPRRAGGEARAGG
ncbi:endonuclease III [Pyrodictium occultum]|uniref:Endonuclease III n=1 Tax=Pyrodictium occultum TaxID=2309 RepID=A0A0V8RX48_PYROC|nr:endonuclease III [Pyrodictium occultum]KSW12612.1 endonuclease III [Pyrodictium occultum]